MFFRIDGARLGAPLDSFLPLTPLSKSLH